MQRCGRCNGDWEHRSRSWSELKVPKHPIPVAEPPGVEEIGSGTCRSQIEARWKAGSLPPSFPCRVPE
ncbi:hypothetical protein NDU88_003694 [Pleurodeles waltl]|uniref:Uncharacterized protein n=1 Tax=Pleurodeles waltl TaxID=8319 RepID=A0AAV7W2W5_PLEWA|nr:hypothetical protein NDU88_003694 [Pleurodeles waltl]